VIDFDISAGQDHLTARAMLPVAQLAFERRIELAGRRVMIQETVENLSALDRPIAWTQHATLGPPFLERGITQFRTPATRSRTLTDQQDFMWPRLPESAAGPARDLRVYTDAASSGGFTTHLMDPQQERAFAFAYSPNSQVLFGYVWQRSDFPWLGIWEENHSRTQPPWNGRTMTLGLEFGVSPFPESRRAMIDRHVLFDTPCYAWIPAKKKRTVHYYAAIGRAPSIPETVEEFENAMR
jgi:hypothetical protein